MKVRLHFFCTCQKVLSVSFLSFICNLYDWVTVPPVLCRNEGQKTFDVSVFRDASEKIQTIKKWEGYEGGKVFSCTF